MPLFVDADEGFGRALNTFYGCRRMARAGAGGIQINDLKGSGQEGLLPIDEAVYRMRAAKEGMAGTDCVLIGRCDHSVDDNFDELVERCNRYIDAGADMIMPVKIISSTKYGGKAGAARKVAEHVKAKFWYPNLNKGEKAAEVADLWNHGYKFVGIHYAFRAAMLAMLDAGRHVFETRENDHIDTVYDHTGYKFYYSPVAAFFRGGEWVNREIGYVAKPEDAEAARIEKQYVGPTDAYGPK
jgi:methylisocitrate lyase